jgi:hypothetical protein
VLTEAEVHERIGPHLAAIARAFAKAVDAGVRDPAILAGRPGPRKPFRVRACGVGELTLVLAELVRLARRGGPLVVVLMDGDDVGVACAQVSDASPRNEPQV